MPADAPQAPMAPLLEREAAWARLQAALEEAQAGTGLVVLVTGEAGIGKTTLVDRFIDAHPGVRFLRGGCEALATPRPLGALFDFESRLPERLRDDLRAEADRRSDFYRGLLAEFSQPGHATALVLEDLHWADAATLELVRFLGRRVRQHRALVLLTARDDPNAREALASAVGDLPAAALWRVELPPLSVEAVGRLAGGGWSAADLHRATGGNPFFVTEVLGAPGHAAPPNVRDAIAARVRMLAPAARAFIGRVAIFPRQAAVEELQALGAFDVAAADECIAAGLLLLEGGVLRFRHELARACVEESLPAATRLAWHRGLLQSLATRATGTVALARLAHHAREAADPAEILRWAPAAAREAAARGSRREAASQLDSALQQAGQLPPAGQAVLHEQRGEALFALNRLEEAVASYARAAALFAAAGNAAAQARCLARQAMPLVRRLANDEADRASAAALALAEGSGDDAVLGFATVTESYLRMLNRDYLAAIAAGRRAITIAEALDDPALLAEGLKTTGAATLFLDYDAGCRLLERSLEVAHGLDDGGVATADAFLMLGTASGELFEFAAAERAIEEGIAFARSRDLDRQALYMEAWQALCDLHQGRWDAAGLRARQVLDAESQPSTARLVALVTLGRLRVRRGDPGAAEVLDEALALGTRSGTLQRLGPACLARAEAAWLRGDRGHVLREVDRVWDLARAKGQRWIVGELAAFRWRCGEAPGDLAGCAEPWRAEIEGDAQAAAALWQARGCGYEAARALAGGDAAMQLCALATLDTLGAVPLATQVRARLRASGHVTVPRGPLARTRANVAGLTKREFEVLQLLAGDLRSHEIAARLSRSVRTVDHHLEAVYAKLEVSGRAAAVARARTLGLLAPDTQK